MVYQEEPNSTFTHDGQMYDLNYLLRLMADYPIVDIPVDELTWVLEYDFPDIRRLIAADLEAPVLVTWWEDKLVVIDGLHRMAKAMVLGHQTILGKYVPLRVLEWTLITK